MKIAIQGHPTRGKEVIQILESLGGNNYNCLSANASRLYYYIGNFNHIDHIHKELINHNIYKLYTLEEFEKEFPFKIGDKIITTDGTVGIIDKFKPGEYPYCIKADVGGFYWCATSILKPYKEMNTRNVTLTLDKAKEWYNKGGELKEVALQAYSENELSKVELPKTWEEFCDNYRISDSEAYFDSCCTICSTTATYRNSLNDKNICPSKKSAEAHLAMIQLEQLRDYYNNNSDAWGWSYSIIKRSGIPELVRGCDHDTFLRFKNIAIATQFLECFKDLIEKAGDLI